MRVDLRSERGDNSMFIWLQYVAILAIPFVLYDWVVPDSPPPPVREVTFQCDNMDGAIRGEAVNDRGAEGDGDVRTFKVAGKWRDGKPTTHQFAVRPGYSVDFSLYPPTSPGTPSIPFGDCFLRVNGGSWQRAPWQGQHSDREVNYEGLK